MKTTQHHPLRNSNASVMSKKRPLSFRVIIKSKSGFLANSVNDVKENPSIANIAIKTQTSLKNEDIKHYVKSMKNKTANEFHKVGIEGEQKSNRSYER